MNIPNFNISKINLFELKKNYIYILDVTSIDLLILAKSYWTLKTCYKVQKYKQNICVFFLMQKC